MSGLIMEKRYKNIIEIWMLSCCICYSSCFHSPSCWRLQVLLANEVMSSLVISDPLLTLSLPATTSPSSSARSSSTDRLRGRQHEPMRKYHTQAICCHCLHLPILSPPRDSEFVTFIADSSSNHH